MSRVRFAAALRPAAALAVRAPAARLCALPALQLHAPVVASSAARALFSQPRRAFASSSFLDKADVTDRVMGCLKNFQKVDPTKVSETSHFLNDLGLDSLDTVEVVMAFEDEFCIEVCRADPPARLPSLEPRPPLPATRGQTDQRPAAHRATRRFPMPTPRRSTPARTRSATSFSIPTPSEEGHHELRGSVRLRRPLRRPLLLALRASPLPLCLSPGTRVDIVPAVFIVRAARGSEAPGVEEGLLCLLRVTGLSFWLSNKENTLLSFFLLRDVERDRPIFASTQHRRRPARPFYSTPAQVQIW